MDTQKQLVIYLLLITTILLQLNNCNCNIFLTFHHGFDEFEPSPSLNISDGSPAIPSKLSSIEKILLTVKLLKDSGNNDDDDDTKISKNKQKFKAIFPGTLWCGDGNIASHDNELGAFHHADACCRHHDKCSFHVDINTAYGPLFNNGLFGRSACYCEYLFYKCLKLNSIKGDIISYKIGFTYFSILRPQCMGYAHPQKPKCNLIQWMLISDCSQPYRPDTSKPKTLQWFSSPCFY